MEFVITPTDYMRILEISADFINPALVFRAEKREGKELGAKVAQSYLVYGTHVSS